MSDIESAILGVNSKSEDDVTRDLSSGRGDSPILVITKLLWKKRIAIRNWVTSGVLAGLLVATIVHNRYTATVQLMPPDMAAGPAGMAMFQALSAKSGMGASIAGDLLGLNTSADLFIGILRSRTVEDRLINRFDLRRVYWHKTYAATRYELDKKTDIAADRKSGIISIAVTDNDPRRAAALAQAYVQELDRLMSELTTSSAHRERVFLEQRLDVVHKDLQDASRQFSEFSSKNTAIDIQEQGKAMVGAVAAVQGQLIAAESELHGLEQIYSPENVRVRSMRARIAELKQQLNKLGGDGETTGSPATSAFYPSIRELPVLGLEYAELYRRVKIQETVFEILTQQYELAKVQEAKEIPSVKVLDPAEVPEKKSGPHRLLFVIAGAVLAFALSSMGIVGQQLWLEIDSEEPHKAFIAENVVPVLRRQVRRWRNFILRRRPATTNILDR